MITEKRFAASHHAFWRELFPTAEHYIRTANQQVARLHKPFAAASEPRSNGVINELSFRLFVRSARENVGIDALSPETVAEEVSCSRRFIENFRQHGRGRVRHPDAAAIADARALAKRTGEFFKQASDATLVLHPRFTGCGWISECEGDVFSASVLYEVKSGERTFRTMDVRQVLVYCALNFAAKAFDIRDVCLVNPREGVYFAEPLERLCQLSAGRSSVDVLGDIVEYMSEATEKY